MVSVNIRETSQQSGLKKKSVVLVSKCKTILYLREADLTTAPLK